MWMPLRGRQDGDGFANSTDNPGCKSGKSGDTEPDSPNFMRFYLCVFPIGLYEHGILLVFSANPVNSVVQKENQDEENFFFTLPQRPCRRQAVFWVCFP